jgi:hypothetical protein
MAFLPFSFYTPLVGQRLITALWLVSRELNRSLLGRERT